MKENPNPPFLVPNVVSVTAAAKEKGCVRQTIYNAVDAGRLNAVYVGTVRMICRDEAYESFAVRETGGRTHKKG